MHGGHFEAELENIKGGKFQRFAEVNFLHGQNRNVS